MSDRSKVHHFIPKVLQKPFCHYGDRIWYSKKTVEGTFEPPHLRNIKTTFNLRNYYTILEGEDRSDIVEREHYGKIDNYLGQILPEIISAFKNEKVPTFSGSSLANLSKVVFEMAKRTPEFVKSYNEEEIGREAVTEIALAYERSGDIEQAENFRKKLNSREYLREYGRNIRVRATVIRSPRVDVALDELKLRWSVSRTRHSYILSSSAAYRIGNGGPNGLSNPNFEIWMPVMPKVALVLTKDPNNNIPLVVTDTPEHIRAVNQYAAEESTSIASHSQRLIESITRKRSRK